MQTFQDCLHVFTKQLLDRSLDFCIDAKEYYHERFQKSQGQRGTPPLLSIDENISLIKQFCLKLEVAFLVLDGLDECTNRGEFIQGLMSLSEENSRIKLFIRADMKLY